MFVQESHHSHQQTAIRPSSPLLSLGESGATLAGPFLVVAEVLEQLGIRKEIERD